MVHVVGHRGASGYCTENTLASFDHAIAQGVDAVECDIRPCATGELVVFHDDTLERLCARPEAVGELTFSDLRTVSLPGETSIPTLEEMLARIGGKVGVHIELKTQGVAQSLAPVLRRALADYGFQWPQLRVISFFHRELLLVKEVLPEAEIAPILAGNPVERARLAADMGAVAIHPALHFVDNAFVEDAHQRGLEVCTWTANTERDIRHAMSLGVDAICGNYPDRIRALVDA